MRSKSPALASLSQPIPPGGRYRLGLILVLIIFIFVSLPSLNLPFYRNQGIYAYVAWVWTNHRLPYRDAFENRGPLLHVIYAAALAISQRAMWGVNLADLLARAAAIFLSYWAGGVLRGKRFGLYAAFLIALPLFSVFNSPQWNAEAETFMLPLSLLSFGLVLLPKPFHRFFAGVIAAQTVALKPTALLYVLFLLYPAFQPPGGKRGILIYLAGVFCGLAPWVCYFLAKGALYDLFIAVFLWNAFYSGPLRGLGIQEVLVLAKKTLGLVFHFLPFLALLGLLAPRRLLLLGWTLAAIAQVVIQAKFFLYHWLVLLPPLAFLAASFFTWIMDRPHPWLRRAIWIILAIELLLDIKFYLAIQYHYRTWHYLFGRINQDQFYSRFRDPGDNFNFHTNWQIAQRLQKHSTPPETLLVFGYEPGINYLAQRFSPSRFHYDSPLTFPPNSDFAAQWREKWRRIFLADLERQPPSWILLVEGDANPVEAEDSLRQAQQFLEFWHFLEKNYTYRTTIENYQIYQYHADRLPD